MSVSDRFDPVLPHPALFGERRDHRERPSAQLTDQVVRCKDHSLSGLELVRLHKLKPRGLAAVGACSDGDSGPGAGLKRLLIAASSMNTRPLASLIS